MDKLSLTMLQETENQTVQTIQKPEIRVPITDPKLKKLINEVRKGKIPQTVLYDKIGRYPTEQALSSIEKLDHFFKTWLDAEITFIKKCFGVHNGRAKVHYEIDEHFIVETSESGDMCLVCRKQIETTV